MESRRRGLDSAEVEISTEELKQVLLEGKVPVIDVRPEKEFAISHIPGSVNIFETKIEEMMQVTPDKLSGPVTLLQWPALSQDVSCCRKTFKERVHKYQEVSTWRLPVWRAFGNTAETSLSGFKYIYSLDKTAVIVDARSKRNIRPTRYPGAINIHQASEIEAANNDGRLPYTDHGTRIIVFGSSISQARNLAEAIAQRAYWNSGYLAGTHEDLKKAGL